jgi:hypothetical protein
MSVPLTVAFMAATGRLASQAPLLARSIRAFGGALADMPVWAFVPNDIDQLPEPMRAELQALGVVLVPFALDPLAANFPFAGKVYAAAEAESQACDRSAFLAWMDTGSLVIQEPADLCLESGITFGYRPVDHTLIGSPYEEPPDDFWRLVYQRCEVPEERLFSMTTSVDLKQIRPYFNGGMLVVRPGQGQLRLWRDYFEQIYRRPEFAEFYSQETLFRIFFHQAVLAAAILVSTAPAKMRELPYRVNYPLHMHDDYPAEMRPARLNDLITCRYERFFDNTEWRDQIAVGEPLKGWLEEYLPARPDTTTR